MSEREYKAGKCANIPPSPHRVIESQVTGLGLISTEGDLRFCHSALAILGEMAPSYCKASHFVTVAG